MPKVNRQRERNVYPSEPCTKKKRTENLHWREHSRVRIKHIYTLVQYFNRPRRGENCVWEPFFPVAPLKNVERRPVYHHKRVAQHGSPPPPSCLPPSAPPLLPSCQPDPRRRCIISTLNNCLTDFSTPGKRIKC